MENKCPKCKIGILVGELLPDGKIIEYCTQNDCDYRAEHIDRRKKQAPINFSDRRNNNSKGG